MGFKFINARKNQQWQTSHNIWTCIGALTISLVRSLLYLGVSFSVSHILYILTYWPNSLWPLSNNVCCGRYHIRIIYDMYTIMLYIIKPITIFFFFFLIKIKPMTMKQEKCIIYDYWNIGNEGGWMDRQISFQ